MIWGIIINILVGLLVAFLTDLFKKSNLATANIRGVIQVPNLVGARADFIDSVKYRFWLGPKRQQWAGALFDRAATRLSLASLGNGIENAVKFATNGLEKLTPAELEKSQLKANEVRFGVQPSGLVQGGDAAYTLDEVTGTISYRASIKVGKWFLSKTYQSSGNYKLDPTLLNPTNLAVGKVFSIGDLKARVVSVNASTALLSLTVPGGTGSAIVLTNHPVLVLNALDATVTVSGITIVLGLRPA